MTEPFWQHDFSVKFPCKGCQDRHQACWSDCERYKQAKAEQDEKSQQKRKQEQIERDYIKARAKHKHPKVHLDEKKYY